MSDPSMLPEGEIVPTQWMVRVGGVVATITKVSRDRYIWERVGKGIYRAGEARSLSKAVEEAT